MSTLIWYAPIGAMHVIGAFVTALVFAAVVWAALCAIRPWSRYPWTVVWVLTVLIAVNGIARNVPEIRSRAAAEASLPELRDVNGVYQALLSDAVGRDAAVTMLGGLSPSRWDPEAAEMALSAIALKSERYADIYQSLIAGRVVRSGHVIGGRFERELEELDRRIWDPLLESAAAGGPVELTEGAWLWTLEEAHWHSLLATRARLVLLETLEQLYAVPVTLSPADRALAPALEWLSIVLTAPERAVSTADAFAWVEAVVEATWSGTPNDAYRDVRQHEPAFVESLVAYLRAQELIELEYARWLVASALGRTPPVPIDAIDAHRRLLGMPIGFTDDDVAYARSTGLMPDETALSGLAVDVTMLDEIESRLEELKQRYERLEPGMQSLILAPMGAAGLQ